MDLTNELTKYGNVCDIHINNLKKLENYQELRETSREIDSQIDKLTANLWSDLLHGPQYGNVIIKLDINNYEIYNMDLDMKADKCTG